jgi:hypothetical protein
MSRKSSEDGTFREISKLPNRKTVERGVLPFLVLMLHRQICTDLSWVLSSRYKRETRPCEMARTLQRVPRTWKSVENLSF